MPRISAFYGVVITMYFSDHPPPHFHARYGDYQAQVDIATGSLLSGFLPRRAANLVAEWAGLHHAELEANWQRAVAEQPLASVLSHRFVEDTWRGSRGSRRRFCARGRVWGSRSSARSTR